VYGVVTSAIACPCLFVDEIKKPTFFTETRGKRRQKPRNSKTKEKPERIRKAHLHPYSLIKNYRIG